MGGGWWHLKVVAYKTFLKSFILLKRTGRGLRTTTPSPRWRTRTRSRRRSWPSSRRSPTCSARSWTRTVSRRGELSQRIYSLHNVCRGEWRRWCGTHHKSNYHHIIMYHSFIWQHYPPLLSLSLLLRDIFNVYYYCTKIFKMFTFQNMPHGQSSAKLPGIMSICRHVIMSLDLYFQHY